MSKITENLLKGAEEAVQKLTQEVAQIERLLSQKKTELFVQHGAVAAYKTVITEHAKAAEAEAAAVSPAPEKAAEVVPFPTRG